ncbi:hypothetical protein ACFVUB_34455 [Streptomyces niveus]|uniref:hypothetical protein n=1 Tax=Streptomyces niveus TaxID=193462 RepID=UPI0036DA9671
MLTSRVVRGLGTGAAALMLAAGVPAGAVAAATAAPQAAVPAYVCDNVRLGEDDSTVLGSGTRVGSNGAVASGPFTDSI